MDVFLHKMVISHHGNDRSLWSESPRPQMPDAWGDFPAENVGDPKDSTWENGNPLEGGITSSDSPQNKQTCWLWWLCLFSISSKKTKERISIYPSKVGDVSYPLASLELHFQVQTCIDSDHRMLGYCTPIPRSNAARFLPQISIAGQIPFCLVTFR